MQPSGQDKERLVLALAQLQGSPHWDVVSTWMRAEQARLTNELVDFNDECKRGAIQTLRVLLELADTARDQAQQIRIYRDHTGPVSR